MKKILTKSLRRLHTLLLMAVLFVVGGSSAWAETVTFNVFASNITTKAPITVSGYAESNKIVLYSGSPSFTIAAASGYTITQVDLVGDGISAYLNTSDGNKGTVGGTIGTWYFQDKESITFSGSFNFRWDMASVSSITVTYHASAPAEPVKYTIKVNNTEGAEGAGVTYDGKTYTHNQTFSTTAQVKESDFQVVPVEGYATTGSLSGTTYTATYTKQYAYTVVFEGLSAADAHKGAIVADGKELGAGTHYFDAPLSDFSVKEVKFYDKGELVSSGSGKDITLSATYTPFVDVDLVVEGLTAAQRESFYFQINGNTFKVNDQVKVSPKKSVQTWIYDAAALSFKGMSYKVVYNEDENTIVVTYSQLEPGANYDFANTVPAAYSWQDDAINTVYFYIPNNHEVDMEQYQGSMLLQVQRGDEGVQNVQASYQVYGMDHYVQIEFPSSYKAYCGPIAITIPEGFFSTKFWDGGVQKTSTNNAMTLSFNTKYHYMVYYDQEGKTNLTGAKILVDGVEYPVNNAVATTAPISKDAITVVNPTGYEGVITNIDPATNSNYGYGAIYVNYERIYTYDDLEGTTTTKKNGEIKLDYVTLNFPKDVYELNGQITMDGIPVSRTQFSYPGHTELTIYFAETVYGEGEHTLVIPQGYFCIPNGTYNYRDVDDYDRNSKMEIIYTLAPSYVYNVTIVDENGTQAGLPNGAGIQYDNATYTNGKTIYSPVAIENANITLLSNEGYNTDVTITAPTEEANGTIKVVYTLVPLKYDIVIEGLEDASDVKVTVSNALSTDGNTVETKGNVTAEKVTASKVPFYEYSVNVTDPEGENNGIITVTYTELAGPFVSTFDVTKPQVFTVGETYMSVDGNIGLTYASSAGWGDPMGYYDNDEGKHFYALGTFKFTAPNGYVITNVNMESDGSWCYQDWYIYCDTKGTFDYGTTNGYRYSYATWSGSKNEVVFRSTGSELRYRTITVTYEKYVAPTPFEFAAADFTPAPTTPIEKFGTITINAPEGVTFTGWGDNNSTVKIDDTVVYLYNWNSSVTESQINFEVNQTFENGEHTLAIPENFVTAAGNKINAAFSVVYSVFDPYFNLAFEEGFENTAAKLETLRIVAPEDITFDAPSKNVTISVDGEDTSASASLENNVIVITIPAVTKQGSCNIRIAENIFTANEGTMKNKSWNTSFNIKPALAINENSQDAEGNYWTTFCYNQNAVIDGATPYIVVGKDGSSLELKKLEGVYPSATATYYVDYKNLTYVSNNQLYCPDYGYDGLSISLNNVGYTDGSYLTFSNGSSMTIESDVNIQKVELSGNYGGWYEWSVNGGDAWTRINFDVNAKEITLASDYAYITQIRVYYDDVTKDRKAPVIPANTGILVKGTTPASPINYTPASGTPANVDGNLLWGCTQSQLKEVGDDKYIYKLAWANDQYENLGFYWGVDGGHSIQANSGKAYLILDAEQSAGSNRCLIFGGAELPTAIDFVETADDDAPIFNLQGKRVSRENLPAGVYVKNGRKFIVK